ncbi:MAG: hypothetical protein WCF33_07570 [Pseudonocardiaceae bacterium]
MSAGLFSYPVLMAVDIRLYDIARVPVGDDQRQHLELTRTIAQRFNGRYGPIFVLPETVVPPVVARVRDLQDPSRKMSASSESDAGVIDILDSLNVIVRKIRRAVTDAEAEVRYDAEAKPRVSNLLEILGACTGEKAVDLAGISASKALYGRFFAMGSLVRLNSSTRNCGRHGPTPGSSPPEPLRAVAATMVCWQFVLSRVECQDEHIE